MDFLSKNKVGIAVGVGALALFAGYLVFFKEENAAVLESTQQVVTSPVSRQLLVTLADLRTVQLDDSLFTDPAFSSLVDYGVEIPLQPIGRRNPFEPLGASSRATTQTTPPAQAPR